MQAAVNAASANATIYVCAGTYPGAVSIGTTGLTLDGAEYGVDAVGRTGQPETVIDSTSGVTYHGSALTGEAISGFTLDGYTGSGPGVISANPSLGQVGSAWTFTDDIIDASEGGIGLNTDSVSDPGATTIADNEFMQATPSTNCCSGGWQGQAITFWGGSANNVSISHNDFYDLSGPGAAINTTGSGSVSNADCASTPSTGLDVSDNTWEENNANDSPHGVNENFIALFCTSGAQISGNTNTIEAGDTGAEGPIFLGGGNTSPVVSGNTVTGDGTTSPDSGGAIAVTTGFYAGDSATIESNIISGWGDNGADGQGIIVCGCSEAFGDGAIAAPTGVVVENNTVTDNGDGIQVYNDDSAHEGYPSVTVTGNTVSGSITDDCDDQTSGSGTAGTNDTWSNDTGATSSPAGLCQAVTTTTTSLSGDSQSGTAITVPAGSAVTDSATLSGANSSTAGGTVTYTVFSDSDCTTSAGSGGTVTVSDGSVPASSAVTLDSAGTYYWQASYSGDSANAASTSACGPGDEVETVATGTTSLTTSLSGDSQSGTTISVPVNTAVTDAATLSGTYASIAGGTVTYTVFSDSACTTSVGSGGTVNVTDGSVPASSAVTLTNAGTYYWQASYSGDVANDSSKSTCGLGEEVENVSLATSTTQTTPNSSTGALGGPNSDVAVVQGDASEGSPTGTVTFYECGPTGTPTDCTSQAHQVGSPVNLTAEPGNEAKATSISFTADSTGYWCFAGYYSGSPDYANSSDTSVDECYDVTSATTSLTTAPSNATINLGQSDTDAGTVTGNAAGGSPTGSMTFFECGPTSTPTACTSQANQVGGAVTLTPGANNTATASSAPFTPNAVGYWCFAGYYSSDSNYLASSDATVDECVDVAGPLTMVTTSLPDATVGQSYSFGIVVRGGKTPYRWSLGGRLPRGLSLNRATGVISGTPTRVSSKTFAIRVVDSSRPHQRVTAHFTITVNG